MENTSCDYKVNQILNDNRESLPINVFVKETTEQKPGSLFYSHIFSYLVKGDDGRGKVDLSEVLKEEVLSGREPILSQRVQSLMAYLKEKNPVPRFNFDSYSPNIYKVTADILVKPDQAMELLGIAENELLENKFYLPKIGMLLSDIRGLLRGRSRKMNRVRNYLRNLFKEQ